LDIAQDKQNNFWFTSVDHRWGDKGGITHYDPQTGQFTHLTTKEGLKNNPHGLFLDSKGNLWFGIDGTISCITFDTTVAGVEGQIMHYPIAQESIKPNIFRFFLEDSKQRIWIGTDEGIIYHTPINQKDGLTNALNKQPVQFEVLASADGLVVDRTAAIVEDHQQNIWLSSSKGLTILRPVTNVNATTEGIVKVGTDSYQIFKYGKKDGLRSTSLISNYLDKNNRMWWGNLEGLMYLDLDEFELPNQAPQQIQLTQLDVNNEFINFPNLKDTTYQNTLSFGQTLATTFDSIVPLYNYPVDLTLPHQLNHLTFHFSAIDWTAPHQIQYSYKVEGLDEEWSKPNAESKVAYRNLPAGNFTFKVKAKGIAQTWSDAFDYSFTVLPPWWLTWWAKMLYALAILGVFYLWYQWRTKQQRQKLLTQEKIIKKEQALNQQLQRVDELKDQFLANTSHELRTPLHGIIGLSEAILDRSVRPDDQEDLSMIIASGKRLGNLVNDILDFSKLKSADIQLIKRAIPLHSLVDIVLKTNAPLTKGKINLTLVNEIATDLPLIEGDENRLQQILFNLIGNAIKFTETGSITVSAKVIEEKVQIAVTDTGTGIPVNKLDAIFQEFEQGDGSTTRQFTGTGLGLSISKKLVELHGGQMWVESAVGKGATFMFTMPLAGKTMQRIEASATTEAVIRPLVTSTLITKPIVEEKSAAATMLNKASKKVRLLVVDDEPINQQVLKNHLSAAHYELVQAMNGEEAMKIVNHQPKFDLILLDVMMPRMSGYEVCEQIRKEYLPSELPIIMVTAKNQVQDLVQGLTLGANDYVSKPFTKQEFLARVKNQLNLHRINQATEKFIPNEFLRLLGKSNITEIALGDNTQREVTIFFSDIRAYTSLSEQMSPDDNFRFVNAYNGRMGPIIQEHNGFVNQYLGDGIMAIFTKSPTDALRAAIQMQLTLQAYNQKRIQDGRSTIQVGMGMHTGDLIMGIIGDANRLDAATIADSVNAAARIENLSKYFGTSILLSEACLDKIADKTSFNFRYLGQVQVKGKQQILKIHECFDGDTPASIRLKQATLTDFSTGIQAYLTKEFIQAAVAFEKVLKQNPSDKTAELFLKKVTQLVSSGVADDWTGVERLEKK